MLGIIDCPRLRLNYKIDDGYVSKDEGIKNIILMYGCKVFQDLKQPCVWAVFNLLKKLRQPNQEILCLPDDLVWF